MKLGEGIGFIFSLSGIHIYRMIFHIVLPVISVIFSYQVIQFNKQAILLWQK